MLWLYFMFFLGNIQVYITFYTYWLQTISSSWRECCNQLFHAQLVANHYSNKVDNVGTLFSHTLLMFGLHLAMSWKKEVKTKRSISNFFGRYLKSNYAVLSLVVIHRWSHPNAACIYKIAANMWRSGRNRIACIANGSIGVAYIAIGLGPELSMSQASPSEGKRIVFRSHLIANRALFDRARSPLYKMLIGDL